LVANLFSGGEKRFPPFFSAALFLFVPLFPLIFQKFPAVSFPFFFSVISDTALGAAVSFLFVS